MRYPSPTLDGFDGLWSHPARWLLRQLTFYLTLAAITAVAFVIGSGIYAYLISEKSAQVPSSVPLPIKKPPLAEKPLQLPSWPEGIPI
jgi:hypothetical protein